MNGSRCGVALAAALAACSGETDGAPVPVPTPEAGSVEERLRFVDATAEAGLDGFRQVAGSPDKPYITDTAGAGVAFLDHDRDGDLDVYLSNGSTREAPGPEGPPRDAFFENVGDGRFRERTVAAGLGDEGWSYGVRAVDVDGDGWSDLYVTNRGPNVLYRNRGDGGFDEVAGEAGVADPRWSTGTAFLDHDLDGDLDLYVVNHIEFDLEWVRENASGKDYHGVQVMVGPRGLEPADDAFYVQEEPWRFRDASSEVGIVGDAHYGYQAVAFDHDLDGRVDVYVANDSLPNFLWHNLGGRFEDIAFKCGVALNRNGAPQAGMGVAVGDFDGDLIADLFVTNFSEDYFTLYQGSKTGFYADVSYRANVGAATISSLGWGCGFDDFDGDGDLDLYALNGHVYPQVDLFDFGTRYRQRNQVFLNEGGGRFAVLEGGAGPGFELEQASRGGASGDYDGDGDVDLLVGNVDGPPALLRNESPQAGERVEVQLVGAGRNRDAVGARMIAAFGGRQVLRLVGTGSGFLSSSDPRVHIGLGGASAVERLEVFWPDGSTSVHRDLPAGHRVTIQQGEGVVSSEPLGG